MNAKDIQLRSYVHHRVFFNWGRGVVLKRRDRDNLGYKTAARFFVKWESDGKATWCRASELRKTPRPTHTIPHAVLLRIRENERRKEDFHRSLSAEQLTFFTEDENGESEPFYPNEFDGPGD